MTDTATILLVTSIGSTVAAIATTITALITNRGVAAVHKLTNTNFHEQKEEIAALREQVEALKAKLGSTSAGVSGL